jgi:hypothetical protein
LGCLFCLKLRKALPGNVIFSENLLIWASVDFGADRPMLFMRKKNMAVRQKAKVSAKSGRLIVKKPSKLKDYMRLYGIKTSVLKKAKELERALSIAH